MAARTDYPALLQNTTHTMEENESYNVPLEHEILGPAVTWAYLGIRAAQGW